MNGLAGAALVLAAGVGAQWLAWRLRIPAIIVLLGVGFALGPLTGWLDVDALLGDQLGTVVGLSVAVILFEGGLGLRWRDVRTHGPVVARLVTLGVLVTGAVATVAAHALVGLPWDIALVLGCLLTVSGPTVILPLLHHVRPDRQTAGVLRWEGILVDPIGAILAVLAFEAILVGGRSGFGVAAAGLGQALLAGILIGLAGGLLIAVLEARFLVPDALAAGIGLAVVVSAYTLSDLAQPESGLIAVTVMGVFLANQRIADMRHILDFKGDLSQILLGVLFILLAARVSRQSILDLDAAAFTFVLVLVLVARPLSVLVSSAGSRLSLQQRMFLAWMAPRGIVAAAVSAFFALRLAAEGRPEGRVLVPLTFLTIVVTVILYGLTARPVARLLGVAGPAPRGVLVVGANAVARALVEPLQEHDIPYLMVDTNPEAVAAANVEGRHAVTVDALDPHFEERIGLEGLGSLWALTANRTTNALAAIRFSEDFGRSNVYQVRVLTDPGAIDPHLRGRMLWDEDATYSHLRERLRRGWRASRTPITDAFRISDWRRTHGAQAIPLYTISQAGIHVFAEDARPEAATGDILVGLVPPKPASRDAEAPEDD